MKTILIIICGVFLYGCTCQSGSCSKNNSSQAPVMEYKTDTSRGAFSH